MRPFSKNIVFVDTEFSTLDPYKGEILSIGLVKVTGEEMYFELEYDGEVSEWVRDNIMPTLDQPKVSRERAKELIVDFIGPEKPFMVNYVGQFDAIYLYKLFGTGNEPFYWLPLDFASMLFADGRNPEGLYELCDELGIDHNKYHRHNALDDAKFLREVYLKIIHN